MPEFQLTTPHLLPYGHLEAGILESEAKAVTLSDSRLNRIVSIRIIHYLKALAGDSTNNVDDFINLFFWIDEETSRALIVPDPLKPVRRSVGLPNFTNDTCNMNVLFTIMYSIDKLAFFEAEFLKQAEEFKYSPTDSSSAYLLNLIKMSPLEAAKSYLKVLHKHLSEECCEHYEDNYRYVMSVAYDILAKKGLLQKYFRLIYPQSNKVIPVGMGVGLKRTLTSKMVGSLTSAALKHLYSNERGELQAPILFVTMDADTLKFKRLPHGRFTDIVIEKDGGTTLPTVLTDEDIDRIEEKFVIATVQSWINNPEISRQRPVPRVIAGKTHKLVLKSFVIGGSENIGIANHETAGFIDGERVVYIDDLYKFTFNANDEIILGSILNYATTLVYEKVPIENKDS